jgi:hypothetical protein
VVDHVTIAVPPHHERRRDNFQRHTDRRPAVGDPARGLVGGEPRRQPVAAATTAPPQRPADDSIHAVPGYSTGPAPTSARRPADIPPVDGVRVIVLPTAGNYSWACGRTYEHMVPVLTLDHIMTPGEADAWRPTSAQSPPFGAATVSS